MNNKIQNTIFDEFRNFFFTKKKLRFFFKRFLINCTQTENKLNVKKRKNLYQEQSLLKKGFLSFRKNFYLEIFLRTLLINLCFWNSIHQNSFHSLKITVLYPKLTTRFENSNNSICERTTVDFNPLWGFFYKSNENFIFGILETFKRLVSRKKPERIEVFRILTFKLIGLFFGEYCKVTQSESYLSKKKNFQAPHFSKIFRIFSGNFSNFGFFFWKLKPEIFLINFINFFLWKLSFKKMCKKFFLIQDTSEFLKVHITGSSIQGYSFFLKIFCFDVIIENFFLCFIGLSISIGKYSVSDLSVLKSSRGNFQNHLQWILRNKEKNGSNFLINRKIVIFKDFLENFFCELEINNKSPQTLKNIMLKKKKNFKHKTHRGENIEGKKNPNYFDGFNSCFDYEIERPPGSGMDFKISCLVFSQFSFDLFQYLKKKNKIIKKKKGISSGKVFFGFLLFYKDFFLV